MLLADEVYQDNIYTPGKQFLSFKKVLLSHPFPLALAELRRPVQPENFYWIHGSGASKQLPNICLQGWKKSQFNPCPACI